MSEIVGLVVSGTVGPGRALPAETDLARQMGVSRLTLREAVQVLVAKGVLDPQHGRGTFVRPVAHWSPLDPALLAARARYLGEDVADRLLEARRIVELAAARLAAQRREQRHVGELEQQLGSMRAAVAHGGLDQWVAADVRFHQVIVDAAGNPVISALFEAIGDVMLEVRRQTSALQERWRRAVDAHERILRAIEAGSPDDAETAMSAHLSDTEDDMHATLGEDHSRAGRSVLRDNGMLSVRSFSRVAVGTAPSLPARVPPSGNTNQRHGGTHQHG
jgi:DNA-binding FadR family transcriptional regulator